MYILQGSDFIEENRIIDTDSKTLLQTAIDLGIIDVDGVKEKIAMEKRRKLLQHHPYSIWEGKNGKWYTYLPDDAKPRGKALIKRASEEQIKKEVAKYWEDKAEKQKVYTFHDVYLMWREVQDQLVSEKSVAKYHTDYIRYFENTDFANTRIERITDDNVRIFMKQSIDKYTLSKESSRKLFGYINNTFLTAKKHQLIDESPTEFLRAKDFYRYCTEKIKPIESKIVSVEEMQVLKERIEKDYQEKPNYIPSYAVEFAMLTGMRVGEIAGLSWDKITDNYILVDQSEKSDSTEKEFWISKTKNGKIRYFPMTNEIRELLLKLRRVEEEYGYLCEWVFANENGRIHKNVISSCSKNKCSQMHIPKRGIHAYRKTLNSHMRCMGVSATVAASILGHTEDVNERYYTFDVTNMDEKIRIISDVNATTLGKAKKVTPGNTNKCSPPSEKTLILKAKRALEDSNPRPFGRWVNLETLENTAFFDT